MDRATALERGLDERPPERILVCFAHAYTLRTHMPLTHEQAQEAAAPALYPDTDEEAEEHDRGRGMCT